MDIKLLKKLFNRPTIKTIDKYIPGWLLVIAMLIGIVMIVVPPFTGGEDGVMFQAYSVYAMFVVGLLAAILAKNKTARVAVLILDAVFFVVYQLILVGAKNDFPYLIRSIQGQDFIVLWLVYSLGAYVVVYFIYLIFGCTILDGELTKLKKETYCDNDIMLINVYSRYRYISYYLLKAKAERVIKVNYHEEQDELMIELYNEYYSDDPIIKQLVDYLKEKESFGKTEISVDDIIRDFEPDTDIYSSGGKALAKKVFKADNYKLILICIGICLVYYVGVTKLIMGMLNGKEIFNLAVFGFPISYIMTLIFVGSMESNFCQKMEENIWGPVYNLFKMKLIDFEDRVQRILIDDDTITEGEKTELLRYYAVGYTRSGKYWLEDGEHLNRYAYIFLNYTAEAELKDAMEEAERKEASGSSGYYGCSSCGGGGCGGGGCGGCGD